MEAQITSTANKKLEELILSTIKRNPKKLFALDELLVASGISRYSMPARTTLLHMVEKRDIRMTSDYLFTSP